MDNGKLVQNEWIDQHTHISETAEMQIISQDLLKKGKNLCDTCRLFLMSFFTFYSWNLYIVIPRKICLKLLILF
jgi:hypothetical protein